MLSIFIHKIKDSFQIADSKRIFESWLIETNIIIFGLSFNNEGMCHFSGFWIEDLADIYLADFAALLSKQLEAFVVFNKYIWDI